MEVLVEVGVVGVVDEVLIGVGFAAEGDYVVAAGLRAAAVVDNEGDPGLCDLGFLSGLSGGSG